MASQCRSARCLISDPFLFSASPSSVSAPLFEGFKSSSSHSAAADHPRGQPSLRKRRCLGNIKPSSAPHLGSGRERARQSIKGPSPRLDTCKELYQPAPTTSNQRAGAFRASLPSTRTANKKSASCSSNGIHEIRIKAEDIQTVLATLRSKL
ncbi:hypothetical protein BC939DRAFT_488635 [Gamsiella multidivaricata]|uniref:uncharacterized protein n=1 Tax=Gamsiella multidivaricata TaxID=101098 RepID=UPI00221F7B92|nr:uncharacterized protein BC939DRAFT_488635 [Gamsiella multidivaricata]KAI7832765.1 hypothetical protein BC939DRAFT_488635 [Gamsiella multidivaricata]